MNYLKIVPLFFALIFLSCASKKEAPVVAENVPVIEIPRNTEPPVSVFNMNIIAPDKQVRLIEKPTLAALDFSAYFANPIRTAGEEPPENYQGKFSSNDLKDYPFKEFSALISYEPAAIAHTAPLAWEPFTKLIYTQLGNDSLGNLIQAIESEKWNEPEVYKSFQKVTRLWGIKNSDNEGRPFIEWWVEVTPAFWTKRNVFYGKLNYKSQGEIVELLDFYLNAELSSEDALNWARTLSSYWYPTLNTDLEVHTPGDIWEKNKPFAVMRGNPMGSPIWIAFEVPAFRLSDAAIQEKKRLDSLVSAGEVVPIERMLDTNSTFKTQTLNALQNACPINEETEKFKKALSEKLNALPKEQNAWEESGMLWFRRNANYLTAENILNQDSLHNPLPAMIELKEFLEAQNIQLLVLPIPVKEEIYADKLVPGTNENLCVSTAGHHFIEEMLKAGIEVLDIYPALKAARASDEAPHYSYQRYDTHWALPGMLAALEQLAARVTEYSWYASSGAEPGKLIMRDTTTLREGDLVAHVPDNEKSKYKADTLNVMKIYKGNEPYKGAKNAPILLMGDSFTGVFESVDQKSGGPGSLLAYATGLDVQVSTSWGGGPGVRSRLKKMSKDLAGKRLVIYMMTARDFYDSPMTWDLMGE